LAKVGRFCHFYSFAELARSTLLLPNMLFSRAKKVEIST